MAKKKQTSKPILPSVKDVEDFDSSALMPDFHVIQPGETLSSIAALYCPAGMTLDLFVVHLNLLNRRPVLVKGMKLKIAGGLK
jgi:hypothetical protein